MTTARDVVLHVGMDKTATSSIQFMLRDNRSRLRELGVLVPLTPGGTRHSRLGLLVKSDQELAASIVWTRQQQSDPATFRTEFRRDLLAEVDDFGPGQVIFSDEALFELQEPSLSRLGELAHNIGTSIRVLAYLRRQDDHLISRYQQQVKVGCVQRLDEWAAQDWSDFYDYYARLRTLERALGPAELVVRRFESSSFVDGSVHQDFLHAAGVGVDAADLECGAPRNQSLDADSVEFLRLLNVYRVECKGAVPGLIDNRRRSWRLAEASTGPVLSLPAARLDEFMTRWAGSNDRTAREFVHDASGQLFRMPRKTVSVTTEQYLSPDRLDQFFDRLGTPERVRNPVRRIAEREARR